MTDLSAEMARRAVELLEDGQTEEGLLWCMSFMQGYTDVFTQRLVEALGVSDYLLAAYYIRRSLLTVCD